MSGAEVARRANWKVFGILALAAALIAVLAPTVAEGSHGDSTNADFVDDSGVLRLHMDDSGDSFSWEDGDGLTHTQNIVETRCEVALSGAQLVTFDGTPSRGAGYKDHGIGHKTGGSQGVDCARVDDTEQLNLNLDGVGLLEGLEVVEAHLDIEVKGGAEVVLATYFGGTATGDTFLLRSGDSIVDGEGTNPSSEESYLATSTSAAPIANCRDRSDSGPDDGERDNCRWVIKDMVPFDAMIFTTTVGKFTLEGGNDGNPAAIEGYGLDTLFFLGDIEGLLDCYPAVAPIGDGSAGTAYGTVTMQSQTSGASWITSDCTLKPYTSGAAVGVVSYVPELSGIDARYTLDVTVPGQVVTVVSGAITSLISEYDPTGSLTFPPGTGTPIPQCAGQPVLSGTHQATFWTQDTLYLMDPTSGALILDGSSPIEMMPADTSVCFYHASVTPTLPGFGTENWSFLFFDDPSVGFR